jgi:two-component sensor histidine kinase
MGTCADVTDRKRAEEELHRSLLEKEVLLKEVHHRVKNNLQVIDSLLQMQAAAAADPATVRILAECQGRIRSMALIHQKLYQSGNFARVSFSEYISDLAAFLFRNYEIGHRVKFDAKLAEIYVPLDTAIPVGLILNELISNSLKYAFPNPRKGTIHIETLQEPGGVICLRYSDDGVGLPKEFEPAKAQSMGFKLIRLLARQIRAQLNIVNQNGLEIVLTFTVSQPPKQP